MNKNFSGTQMQFKSSINYSKEDIILKFTERMDRLESLIQELK
jgi:hypothetical protein